MVGWGRSLEGVVQNLKLNYALPLLLLGGVVSRDLVVEEASLCVSVCVCVCVCVCV